MAVHRPGELAERGELTLTEAAGRLGASTMTVLRLIAAGTIGAAQVCKGAPWAIPEAQLEGLDGPERRGSGPRTATANQEQLHYQ